MVYATGISFTVRRGMVDIIFIENSPVNGIRPWFLWEKLNIKIDCPSPQGGTSTTGNVARKCFQRVDDSKRTYITG